MANKKNSSKQSENHKDYESKSFEEKEREITERFNETLRGLSLML
jgi:hypothetical protein